MKTHFLVTESPQRFDQSIQALCGAKLANPQPVVEVEIGTPGVLSVRSFSDCSRCLQRSMEMPRDDGKKYFYIVIEGEEALHSGDTLEKLEKLVEAKSVNAR